MKTAKWEQSAGALAAFLASQPPSAFVCDLYTFDLVGSINGGNPLLYTTADCDVKVPYGTPLTYLGGDARFDQMQNKSYGHWKVGLDVDTWQVIVAPKLPNPAIGYSGSKIGIVFFLAALRAGALDGAVVSVDRAFFNNSAGPVAQSASITPLGVVNIFTGRVAEVDLGRTNAVISINSHLELLNVNMPRNLYQAGCRWTLFDNGCTLNASSFGVNGTVTTGTTGNTFTSSIAAPSGSGTYSLGRVVMTSGENEGFSRGVRSWVPGTFTLMAPFPFPLGTSDSFTAYPGCSKSLGDCNLFGNAVNFGAQPFIPQPESAT